MFDTAVQILRFYEYEIVVLEGVADANVPKIITAHTKQEIIDRMDDLVFAIFGRIANEIVVKELEGYKNGKSITVKIEE